MNRRYSVFLVLIFVIAVPALANHSWGGYHWARTSNPFTLKLYDNLDPIWEPYLQTAVNDWNRSTVLDYSIQWQQPLTTKRKCGSTAGVVEICNTKYGQNGWLGIAGISISGTHITKGYTKLNDTYYAMAQYNTPPWRQLVTCQEIAHDFGLAHQDEAFDNANLGSCMDYTSDPDGGAGGAVSNDPSNEHPNQHDFDMIQSIYSHNDSSTTIAAMFNAMTESALRAPSMSEMINRDEFEDLGVAVRYDRQGRPTDFVKAIGVNAATQEFEFDITHVFWAPDAPGSHRRFED